MTVPLKQGPTALSRWLDNATSPGCADDDGAIRDSAGPALVRQAGSAADGLPPRRFTTWAVCGLLFVAVMLAFGRSVTCGFVNMDDLTYVAQNPHVAPGFSVAGLVWAFTRSHASNWHPLTWLSHMADCQVYGLWAPGHHLTNLLLHASNAVLLFLVLFKMTTRLERSAMVAALFAVHPLRVESVTWVAERKDVLSGLFFILTLAAYTGYARRPFSWCWYLGVVVLFALGLMSKPMLVTVPFVLLLLDYWPLRRWGWREPADGVARQASIGRLIGEKIPWFALSVASCAVTFLVQHRAMMDFASLPLPTRIGNAAISCVAYLGQLLWPANLAGFYPLAADRAAMGVVTVSCMLLLGISAGSMALWRRYPYLLLGWLWYLGMLAPVIGVVQVGEQAMADRYTYLPMIGPCIAIVWGISDLLAQAPQYRRATCWGMAILVAVLMGVTWRQTGFWVDSEALWKRSLEVSPENPRACTALGTLRSASGRVPEAEEYFRQTLRIDPDYPQANFKLGAILSQSGRTAQAIEYYRHAIRVKPDYAEAYNNLGNALATTGHVAEAIDACHAALRIKPDYAEAHFNLAEALARSGRSAEAVEHFELAISNNRNYATAHCHCGNVLLEMNRLPEALEHYRQAVQINPDYAAAHTNLAEALLKVDRVAEAIEHCERAVRLKPDSAPPHYMLGQCLTKAGRATEAMAQFAVALRVAEVAGQKPLARIIQAEIQRLRQATPRSN